MCLSDNVCDLLLFSLRCKHPLCSRGAGVQLKEVAHDSIVFGGLQAHRPTHFHSHGVKWFSLSIPLASCTDAKGNLWHVHDTPTQATVFDAMGMRTVQISKRDGLQSKVIIFSIFKLVFMLMPFLDSEFLFGFSFKSAEISLVSVLISWGHSYFVLVYYSFSFRFS